METVAGKHCIPIYSEVSVREAELRELLTAPALAEAAGAAAAVFQQRQGPASARASLDEDAAVVRLLLRGPGGRAAAVPQPTVLGLLRAAASAPGGGRIDQAAGPPQKPNSGAADEPTAGAKPPDPFLHAFLAELSRVRAAIAAAHQVLLARLADLGCKLPPAPPSTTSSDSGVAAVSPAASSSSNSISKAATGLGYGIRGAILPQCAVDARAAECGGLRAQADAVAADLVALDDASRAAVITLACLAASHDACRVATMALGDGSDSMSGAQQQVAAVPHSLLAVRSHSAPGGSLGRYTAGVPPDAYHQAVHCLLLGEASTAADPQAAGPGDIAATSVVTATAAPADAVLWGLSVVHARIRHRESQMERSTGGLCGANGPWKAPDRFLRSTTKYWLRPSDALRVKAALCRHLPLLVYGASSPVHTGAVDSVEALIQGASAARGLVSSVYLDSRDMASYHERLRRDDGARATRLRWYGPRQPSDPDQLVFIERKTHREAWTGESSVKERVCLHQSQVHPFLRGELTVNQLGLTGPKAQLLTEVQQHAEALGQTPALRTEYLRSAWQAYDSAAVRVSLDEDMLLLRERGRHAAPGDWCAALESAGPLPGGDALRFPYAVVEVKLAGGTQPPWVKELLSSGLLVPAPCFSKFLHGSALLFPSTCAVAPPWFLPDESLQGRLTPITIEELAAQNAEGRNGWPLPTQGRVRADQEGKESTLPPAPWLMVPGGTPRNVDGLAPSSRLRPLIGGALHAVSSGWRRLVAASRGRGGGGSGGGCGGGASSTASSGDAGPSEQTVRCVDVASTAATAAKRSGSNNGGVPTQPVPLPLSYQVAAFTGPNAAAGVADDVPQLLAPQSRFPGPKTDDAAHRSDQHQYQSEEVGAAWVGDLSSGMGQSTAVASEGEDEGLQGSSHIAIPADTLLGLLEGGEAAVKQQVAGPAGTRWGLLTGSRGPAVGGKDLATKDVETGDSGRQQQRAGRRGAIGLRLLWGAGAASAAAHLKRLRAASVGGARKGGRRLGGAGSGDAGAGLPSSSSSPANDHLLGFTSRPPVAQQLLRARVEPKTFFANERTFLQWIHIGVLVMMTGLGLLTGSSLALPSGGYCWASLTCRAARVSGAIIAPCSVAVMAYALMTFKRRNARILLREPVRYDDQRGPTAITILLVSVTIIAIALAASSLKTY